MRSIGLRTIRRMSTRCRWACLAEARDHDPRSRLPWWMTDDQGRWRPCGSVALAQLPGLLELSKDLGAAILEQPKGLMLPWPPVSREVLMDRLNLQLRQGGWIPGWRDERFALWPLDLPRLACQQGAEGRSLLRMERAAARFWGSLTLGAHCNGWLAGDDGRPASLWIGRRALHKATDPGRLDNLVGGGVPDGQRPDEALWREGWEEAGIELDRMRAARPAGVIELLHDLPEGLQRECLHVYDLELQTGDRPVNQDGEVAEFLCLPVQEALEQAATGEMTLDAALVTLDFGLRRGLLRADEARDLLAGMQQLKVAPDSEGCSKFCNA